MFSAASKTFYRRFGSETGNSAIFKCSPTKVHKCLHPSPKIMVKRADMLKYYEQMTRIRKMELKTDGIYKAGKVRGFCHLYDGQEAVAVGMEAALKPTDHIISAYRCHGSQLLRGDSLRSIFGELMGKKTGSSKGKGGSMHLYMPQNRFYGGNGIVGAQVPIGAGIALASQYKGLKEVTVTMFGDGAANQGQVYESANMAALWKLPLIFLVENNMYGMGTSISRSSFSSQYYTRGDYVPGVQCDGLDVVSVRSTMEHAANHCREGKGPIFVEMVTYRYHGHSMSDPGKSYRNKEEVKEYRKKKDAIKNCADKLVKMNWATAEDLKKIENSVSKEVEEALSTAMADPEPDTKSLFEDIYFNEELDFIRSSNKDKNHVKGAV